MIETLLIFLGILLFIAGIIGAVLPVLPGPPLSYAGFLLFHFTERFHFSLTSIIVFGILALFFTVLDYVLPIWGTKYSKGTKHGILGATLGMIAGLFFPPLGIIAGPFLGAFVAELVNGANQNKALKSAFGSFLGLFAGTFFKLLYSIIIIIFLLRQVF